MPTFDLILSGINLMFIGMGVVFSFLVILVYSMLGMSILAKLTGGELESQENKPITQIVHTSPGSRAELVAVIGAAIARFRATHN